MRRLMPAMIIGISLILSAAVFGAFFYRSRVPEKTIRVVGAATKSISADIVKWRVTLVRRVGPTEVSRGYAQINGDLQSFIQILQENGIGQKELTVQPANSRPLFTRYEEGAAPAGYNITQSGFIVSRDISKVEELALKPGVLADRGIQLESSNLEYYVSNLSEIKKTLLAEATADARRRAAEIAKGTDNTVAYIRSARAGVFQITEPYSTDVSDYGIYNTATKEKDITVTVNAEFGLR